MPYPQLCGSSVENFFAAIKEFRRIATRYDKTDVSFKAMVYLVSGAVCS